MGLLHGCEMTLSYIAHSIFRFIQIIFALAVCGLYGVDLNKADKEHKYTDGKWVCLSLLCSLFYNLLQLAPHSLLSHCRTSKTTY
jgi:hypothetical protein